MNPDKDTRRQASLWALHHFRLHISVVFTALILLVGCALAWSNYLQGRNIVLDATADVLDRIEREVRNEIAELRMPVESTVDWVSRSGLTESTSYSTRRHSLPALADALSRHHMLESIYAGYYNGDFFQLHALRNDSDRERFGAPRHAAYRLQSIERESRTIRFVLLDAALNEISQPMVPPEYNFDPRTRPWFIEAMRSTGLVKTDPYVFFSSRQVGQTIARRAAHGRAVVGADMTLQRLSETLALTRPSPSSLLAVFDAKKGVIAGSEDTPVLPLDQQGNPVLPRLGEVAPALAALEPGSSGAGSRSTIRIDGREWLVRSSQASTTARGDTYLGIAVPSDELLVAARSALQRNLWLTLALVALTVPFTWWLAHRTAANLNALAMQAAAIRRFNFDAPAPLHSRIIEINDLGEAMGRMRETIRKFLDITAALSGERNIARVLRRVLAEAREAAGAQGGVIYLLDGEGRTLKPADQDWDGQPQAGGNEPPDIACDDPAHPVALAVRGAAAHAQLAQYRRPPGLSFLDDRFGTAPLLLVTVPLLDRGGGAIGALCLFVRGDTPPSPERLALVEAFAGAGAVAIHNQQLLNAQKGLFNSLIALIAGAIDTKSHYTAGHCQRVPELTNMLTRAACEQASGPFASFDLDEDGWEALHIAGGLHDCGKVTTPEYVVDKATKLETLYDRIHEVRMRFEVLKRDAEIACLEAIAAGGDAAALRAELQRQWQALDEEFAFVASCNEGGEFMAPDRIARLKDIAGRTWQRTLDDRLGVSWEEAARKAATPAVPLPATEPLLADKAEHIIARGETDTLAQDNPWGFRLDMPQALYNRGELYNLSIQRGTLTEEERYKINDHISQTIIMLSSLPFPRHLKAVPEFAGGHHEKMDGTGYPKRLTGERMSIPARIMTIADIFEALTAADRPYKKAKKLSEAVKIMGFMVKDKHIDAELFKLFLGSGVYLEYARKFMPPELIDEVRVSDYLSASA